MSITVFILYTLTSVSLGWTLCSLYNYRMVNRLCNEIEAKDEIIRKLKKQTNNKDSWSF